MKAIIRLKQLNELLENYPYPLPFHTHLKEYFKHHKNLGSKDRKELRSLAYGFFRLGKALRNQTFEKRVLIGNYLTAESRITNGTLQYLIEQTGTPIPDLSQLSTKEERINSVTALFPDFRVEDIFPFKEKVSPSLDLKALALSYLSQPSVWIRIRKDKIQETESELLAQNITFEKYNPLSWSFPAETNLTELQSFKQGFFRIQDLSTQQTAEFFKAKESEIWWDACAGAGGKSLALKDIAPEVILYATDKRPAILGNLEERFRVFNIKKFETFVVNLEEESPENFPMFDGIIADVPCSGSGTWARNPENLLYFTENDIERYQQKQISILKHIYPKLKQGKPLVYITCSVFTAENEDVINQFLQEHKDMEIEEQKYIKGYQRGAENIFVCRMIKK